MHLKTGDLPLGLNLITSREIPSKASFMNIDFHVWMSSPGEKMNLYSDKDEMAFLIQSGDFDLATKKESWHFQRSDLWNTVGDVLLIPRYTKLEITSNKNGKMLIFRTENDRLDLIHHFNSKNTKNEFFGKNVWDNTALRNVREYFSYENVPDSNLVVGEVITYPGRWSSYLPHYHPQPEMYFFQFDKASAFGLSLDGDHAAIVHHNDLHAIPGGHIHPVSSAPGYPLYYCWVLSQTKESPWTERIEAKEHLWLKEPNVKYWSKGKVK